MENIREKVSYLKGLSDGLGIDHETKEGKIILALIDLVDDMSMLLEDIDDRTSELEEYVDAIDEDLADVEEDVYDDEDEDYDDDDMDDDDGFIEVECPNCKEVVYLDEEMFHDDEEEILCPNCGEPIIYSECDCKDSEK